MNLNFEFIFPQIIVGPFLRDNLMVTFFLAVDFFLLRDLPTSSVTTNPKRGRYILLIFPLVSLRETTIQEQELSKI